MDMQKRLIGPCSTYLPKTDDIEFDFNALVRRLILFDKYILYSTKLKEFKHLIKVFGYENVMELLKSDSLKIYSHAMGVGQVKQGLKKYIRTLKNSKIYGPYSFMILRESISRRKDNISLHFKKEIDTMESIALKRRIKLKNAILDVLEEVPKNAGDETLNSFKQDLIKNSPIIKKALLVKLNQLYGKKTESANFFLKIHQIKEDDFEIETNLGNILNVENKIIYDIILRGVLATSTVNKRIEEMKTYNAISGFSEQDIPVFQEKLNFIENLISSKDNENRFQRVIKIKGFPNISIDTKIKIQDLLRIRESKEVKEFRQWLLEIDKYSDLELLEVMENLKTKISGLFNSRPGQVIRFLITTGSSLISGLPLPVGIGLGSLDLFLSKKILPKSGPLTFINKLYPSIFKKYKVK